MFMQDQNQGIYHQEAKDHQFVINLVHQKRRNI